MGKGDPLSEFQLKDSGDRREFPTGAVRDMSSGKGRYDLLSPLFKRRMAKWLEKGAIKYSARNWEKGIPLSAFMDSLMRHIDKHLEGWRDEDHLAAAAFNLQGLIHTEEMIRRGLLPSELNDLPNYVPENADYDQLA